MARGGVHHREIYSRAISSLPSVNVHGSSSESDGRYINYIGNCIVQSGFMVLCAAFAVQREGKCNGVPFGRGAGILGDRLQRDRHGVNVCGTIHRDRYPERVDRSSCLQAYTN